MALAAAENRPVALLVRNGTFEPYKPKEQASGRFEMTREQAMARVRSLAEDAAHEAALAVQVEYERLATEVRPALEAHL